MHTVRVMAITVAVVVATKRRRDEAACTANVLCISRSLSAAWLATSDVSKLIFVLFLHKYQSNSVHVSAISRFERFFLCRDRDA